MFKRLVAQMHRATVVAPHADRYCISASPNHQKSRSSTPANPLRRGWSERPRRALSVIFRCVIPCTLLRRRHPVRIFGL